jgi:nitronate monooxygenase
MALVPQIVDAVRVPVVAAGGIMDGRGVVAALALGAAGAQLGTCFLTASESGVPQAYRDRLRAATETDTAITRAFTGRPARGLPGRLARAIEAVAGGPLGYPLQGLVAEPIYAEARARGDAELYPVYGGQGTRMAKADRPAREIVAALHAEMVAEIARLGALAR